MKQNTNSIVKIISVALFFCFLLIPQHALADKGKYHHGKERLVIDFGDSFYRGYRGEPVTLHLKRLYETNILV